MKKGIGLSPLLSKLKKAENYTHKYWKCRRCKWLNPIYLNVCWRCGEPCQIGNKDYFT